ncbi:MAG TPA: glutathione-disulfide reductase [Noviherbaspirillum sp.]
MTKRFDVDLFVVGAGSGGVRAARIAASYGARVAIAEEDRVGGTCVIRGCVPKKFFVYASRFAHEFSEAPGYGWHIGTPQFDWPTLQANIARELTRLEAIYRSNLEKAGAELVSGRAVLEDGHTVRLVESGKRITAERILIATGARPHVPTEIAGFEHALVSDDVFNLPDMPKRILIVGGGYIAVEFAGVFAGLGAQTTLVHRGKRLLSGFDTDLGDRLAQAYRSDNGGDIDLLLESSVTRIERKSAALTVHLADDATREVDAVLLATGRVPNTAGLGLEAAGVAVDPAGRIQTDDTFRTSAVSVFAVGDVANRTNLTPVAIREGHAFADREFGKKDVRDVIPAVPSAVFSTPEIASVGLTEEEAWTKLPTLHVFQSDFKPMKHAFGPRGERFFAKLLVDGESDKVVGVHLMGEGAGEMIQLVAVAMSAGATKADFDRTLAVHPTIAEELVTMRTPSRSKLAQGR